VNLTVDFDDQPRRRAIKIDDVWVDRMLLAKGYAIW